MYQYDKTNRKDYQNEKSSRHSVVTTIYVEGKIQREEFIAPGILNCNKVGTNNVKSGYSKPN